MANNYPQPPSLVEIANESGQMTFADGKITGTRVAEVNFDEAAAAVRYFLGAIVIASGGQEIIYPGDPWPGFPTLIATSVALKPMGKTENAVDWSSEIIPHARARLTIQYSTPTWGESSGGSGGPEGEPYIVEDVDYSCEVLSVPVKVTDGSNTKEIKRHFRIPTITYTITIPKMRSPDWSLIRNLSGKVNSVEVFGGAAGTVLFDGPKLGREFMPDGANAWKATYKFIYNEKGWNKQLHPDTLTWVDLAALSGSNKMYTEADLRQLWNKYQF